MEKIPLYTIGHGSRKAEDFLALLQKFAVAYLIDVRSRPYSRFHPQFNRETLREFLEKNGISYVYMGDALGGRPEDRSLYRDNGRPDYEKVRTREFFRRGIDRLKTAYAKNIPAAIMCSERKPQDCHRIHLIGNLLHAEQVDIRHIDENGRLKGHLEVLQAGKSGEKDLFG